MRDRETINNLGILAAAMASICGTGPAVHLTSARRPRIYPKERCNYAVSLVIDGGTDQEQHVLRERWMTGAEVQEAHDAISGCRRITDWRIRRYPDDARFERGPGDLMRLIHRLGQGGQS